MTEKSNTSRIIISQKIFFLSTIIVYITRLIGSGPMRWVWGLVRENCAPVGTVGKIDAFFFWRVGIIPSTFSYIAITFSDLCTKCVVSGVSQTCIVVSNCEPQSFL